MKLRRVILALVMGVSVAGVAGAADANADTAARQKQFAAEQKRAADQQAQAAAKARQEAKNKLSAEEENAKAERAKHRADYSVTVTDEQARKGVVVKVWGALDALANPICAMDVKARQDDRGTVRVTAINGSGDLRAQAGGWDNKTFVAPAAGMAPIATGAMTSDAAPASPSHVYELKQVIKTAGDYRITFDWTGGAHPLLITRVGVALGRGPATDDGWMTLEKGATSVPLVLPKSTAARPATP